MEPNWWDVLIQWAFFFAIVAIFILPAVLLREVAVRHNKRSWKYILLGLAIGMVAMSAGNLASLAIAALLKPDAVAPRLIAFFTAAVSIDFFGYKLLANKIPDSGQRP